MEREQGSLHDRLRDFGREPNPEILASLQNQLAERRGKKRPAWWLLAAAIVFVSGVSTTFFKILDLEQNSNHIIAESTGSDVPHAGGSDASSVSKTTKSQTNHQTGSKRTNQSQDLPDSNILDGPAEKELRESPHVEKSSAKRTSQKPERFGQILAANSTNEVESQVGSLRESQGVESEEITRQPAENLSKSTRKRAAIGKSSLDEGGRVAIRNSRNGKTQIEQRESKTAASDLAQISSSFHKPVLEGEPNQPVGTNSVANQIIKSSGNAVAQQEAIVVSSTKEVSNPKTETPPNNLDLPKKDSIVNTNPKDTVLIAAASDSSKTPAAKRFSFSILAGSRYSAVRYYAINQEKSEFRNQLTNENGDFPSRMSFEAGTRIDYKLGNQFTVFGDLDFGYAKEDLYMLATSALAGQFERTVSGNSLILNPKLKTQKEHIAASIWYSSVLGGFGIQMLPQLPVIRVGAGMQFILRSDVTRQLDGTSISSGKMNGSAGIGFLRISAAKEIPFGTQGRLIIEPVVQYFLNPVYRMKAGTSILPLQTGVQVGWKW